MKTIKAFLLGMWQFRSCVTWADPQRSAENWWYTDLDYAYDYGRDFAHFVTFRRYEDR